MHNKIGILNCYSDEPISGPSAKLFVNNIPNSIIINHCHGEKIDYINKFNGYVVSGSRAYHKDQNKWITNLIEIIKQIYNKNIPCLAVCFGHQVVADIFGGINVKNIAGEEGFQEVPTKEGDESIRLFNGLSNPLKIYQSHNDAVIKAPPGSIQIINNEKCVQYFQFGSIYSIQSHPEIDIVVAIQFAKRDNKDVKTVLNGINKQNIQSYKILKNFSKIVENSI